MTDPHSRHQHEIRFAPELHWDAAAAIAVLVLAVGRNTTPTSDV
jgi:hypothetical protein